MSFTIMKQALLLFAGDVALYKIINLFFSISLTNTFFLLFCWGF